MKKLSTFLIGLAGLCFSSSVAQVPDPEVLAALKSAIATDRVVRMESATRVAAEIDFVGPIEKNVARGVLSLPRPMRDVSHIELQVVQPGGAVAHKVRFNSEGRWGAVFETYRFGVELEHVGIQDGAVLVVDLYQGGQAVAHAEAVLPEQSVRPEYLVKLFDVRAEEMTLNLSYSFENLSLKSINIVPQVTITNQNAEADAVLLQKYMDAVQVGAKSEKFFTHQLDLPSLPGTYEAVVWLFDDKRKLITGALRKIFVVDGEFGVIRSVRLYKDESSGENKMRVKAFLSPSVKGDLVLRVLAEPEVNGLVGEPLLEKEMTVPVLSGQRVEVDLPLDLFKANGGSLKGWVRLELDDQVLAEKDFSFLVTNAKPGQAVEEGSDIIKWGLGDKDEVLGGNVYGIKWLIAGGCLLLLLIVIFWYWRKKDKNIN